jgi:hypothetical protein
MEIQDLTLCSLQLHLLVAVMVLQLVVVLVVQVVAVVELVHKMQLVVQVLQIKAMQVGKVMLV